MLLMYHNLRCECGHMSDCLDDFKIVDDIPYCLDCADDNCIIRTCNNCKCQSADFSFIRDYEVSDFETVYLCENCADVCQCGGCGCNHCYMTGY